MTKIQVNTDCDNAPKKAFIRDFEIAFTKQDANVIINSFTDSIHWEMVGERMIHGIKDAEKMLSTMLDGSISELIIENIITHGDTGAANGTMVFQDGSKFGFCDIFVFSSHGKNAKIKKLQSYVVETK